MMDRKPAVLLAKGHPSVDYEADSDDDEEDTPADIVARTDQKWQIHYGAKDPKLSDKIFKDAVQHQVRLQLRKCGVMVKRLPWRDLIEECSIAASEESDK